MAFDELVAREVNGSVGCALLIPPAYASIPRRHPIQHGLARLYRACDSQNWMLGHRTRTRRRALVVMRGWRLVAVELVEWINVGTPSILERGQLALGAAGNETFVVYSRRRMDGKS